MNILRIKGAALDSLSRFKSAKYPLKNIIKDIIKIKNLNSFERKCLYEIMFFWARENILINKFLLKTIPNISNISNQEKDRIILNIILNLLNIYTDESLVELSLNYIKYKNDLGQNFYLDALGQVIKSELLKEENSNVGNIAFGLFEEPRQYLAFDDRFVKKAELLDYIQNKGLSYSLSSLISTAICVENGRFDLAILPKNWQKHVWVMDAGSQFIASLIRPKLDQKVLDMCTGNGSKLKYFSRYDADLYAIDISKARLDHAEKWLLNNKIKFKVMDGVKTDFLPNSFDWILLDAPCSGTGTIKRQPDLIYRLKSEDLKAYVDLQELLLKEALRLLKPQGKLIYATCSILPCENHYQIKKILENNKNISGVMLTSLLDVKVTDQDLGNKTYFQIDSHIFLCDGFFVSAITKNY